VNVEIFRIVWGAHNAQQQDVQQVKINKHEIKNKKE